MYVWYIALKVLSLQIYFCAVTSIYPHAVRALFSIQYDNMTNMFSYHCLFDNKQQNTISICFYTFDTVMEIIRIDFNNFNFN